MGHADAECGRLDPSLSSGSLTLVIDTSAALNACLSADGFAHYRGEALIAPPPLWSEALSSLHEARWRGAVTDEAAGEALRRLTNSPITRRTHRGLLAEAWRLSDELGWAKTYDAEFIALARLLRCRMVTVDLRMRRAAGRLGFVIGPTEL